MIKEEAAFQETVCARSGAASPTTLPKVMNRRISERYRLSPSATNLPTRRALIEADSPCTNAPSTIRTTGSAGCACCLAAGHDSDGEGEVVASPCKTHHLLSPDWGPWLVYHGTQDVMNGSLPEVLDGLGYQMLPFGMRGAWIVTDRPETVEKAAMPIR